MYTLLCDAIDEDAASICEAKAVMVFQMDDPMQNAIYTNARCEDHKPSQDEASCILNHFHLPKEV